MTISEIFQYALVGILIVSVLTLLSYIFYPNFQFGIDPHYSCNSRFEAEADNIEAAIVSYFAVPERTEIPSIDDLINSGDYTPIENGNPKLGAKLVRDSKLSATVLGSNDSQIIIVVSAKKGRCLFHEGECTRAFMGEVYVKKLLGAGAWFESYDEFKLAEENAMESKLE